LVKAISVIWVASIPYLAIQKSKTWRQKNGIRYDGLPFTAPNTISKVMANVQNVTTTPTFTSSANTKHFNVINKVHNIQYYFQEETSSCKEKYFILAHQT
jgi:hypothetical protein